MVRYMVSKNMDKIIICKALYLFSAQNNPDMLETFSFADINIVHQKIPSFFKSLIQVAVGVIKTPATFNTQFESNASSFSYILK